MKAITILFGAVALALTPFGCGTSTSNSGNGTATGTPAGERTPAPTQPAIATTAPAATPAAQPEPDPEPPQPEPIWVLLDTSMGDIVLQLNAERAPITVDNFLSYVDDGFYDGTIFHRVVPGFVIQGGGFTPDLTKKPTGDPILNEWQNGLKNKRGTISMARTRLADSATTQFFINVADNGMLDMAQPPSMAAYAVFGSVIAGMDVVDEIRAMPTATRGPLENVPVSDVLIERAVRLSPEDAQRYIAAGQ